MMSNFVTLTSDAAAQGSTTGSLLTLIIPFAIMFVLLYFMMIRPQNKKRKAEEKMRKELQVGDEVTTIGGLMGRIVSIKEETDSIVIETGADRSKVRLKRWSIASPLLWQGTAAAGSQNPRDSFMDYVAAPFYFSFYF